MGGLAVRTLTKDAAIGMGFPAMEGLLVTSVQPGSPADGAGVQVGDVITSVASKPVRTSSELTKALESAPGNAVMIDITRGDEKTYGILKR
jgi:S1-C subfamily serine protease